MWSKTENGIFSRSRLWHLQFFCNTISKKRLKESKLVFTSALLKKIHDNKNVHVQSRFGCIIAASSLCVYECVYIKEPNWFSLYTGLVRLKNKVLQTWRFCCCYLSYQKSPKVLCNMSLVCWHDHETICLYNVSSLLFFFLFFYNFFQQCVCVTLLKSIL